MRIMRTAVLVVITHKINNKGSLTVLVAQCMYVKLRFTYLLKYSPNYFFLEGE